MMTAQYIQGMKTLGTLQSIIGSFNFLGSTDFTKFYEKDDRKAIESDFFMVGQDMQEAMKDFDKKYINGK